MSQLYNLIDKDNNIILCKKRAKKIFYSNEKNCNNISTLSQAKTLAAQELGFKDWFHLYNDTKKKILLQLEVEKYDIKECFYTILKIALEKKASDIHIESREKSSKISLRVNGELQSYKHNLFEKHSFYDLMSYIFSSLTTNNPIVFNPSIYQTFSTYLDFNHQRLVLRLQTVPTYPSGNDLVLRVLELDSRIKSLIELGYSQSHIDALHNIMSHQQGLVLFSGIRDAGITTSIKSLLSDYQSKKIFHISNDIGNNLYRSTQVLVPDNENMSSKNNYEKSVNSCLRSEPDIIVFDEMRDKYISQYVAQCAEKTLVISDINAVSGFDIPTRLKDLGLSKHYTSTIIQGIVYQTLLPVTCPHCSIKLEDMLSHLKDNSHQDISYTERNHSVDIKGYANYLRIFKALENKYPHTDFSKIRIRNHSGCTHCSHSGIVGQTICAEVIEINDEIRKLIAYEKGAKIEEFYCSLSDNNISSDNLFGKNLVQHGIKKMLNGIVDPVQLDQKFFLAPYL